MVTSCRVIFFLLLTLKPISDKVNDSLKKATDPSVNGDLVASSKEFSELITSVKEKIAEVEEEKSMRDVVKNELTDNEKETAEKAAAEIVNTVSFYELFVMTFLDLVDLFYPAYCAKETYRWFHCQPFTCTIGYHSSVLTRISC